MIFAVDTNILLDILTPRAVHSAPSEHSLREARKVGSLIVSEPVYAELAAHFNQTGEPDRFLARLGLTLEPVSRRALRRAGAAWRQYGRRRPAEQVCSECGLAQIVLCRRCQLQIRPRQHIVADFIIGAHALEHGDRLITRDKGYYSTYFPELMLV